MGGIAQSPPLNYEVWRGLTSSQEIDVIGDGVTDLSAVDECIVAADSLDEKEFNFVWRAKDKITAHRLNMMIDETNGKALKVHEHDEYKFSNKPLLEGITQTHIDKWNSNTGSGGSNGVDGITPNISIGTVNTLEPHEKATVTRRGSDANPIFDFGIPRGLQGEQGEIGPAGPGGSGETGGGSSSSVIPAITSTPVSNEIFITKTTGAEFTVSGTVSTINGNSFEVGNTTDTDGGNFKATITKSGTIALNITTKGTRYYLIKTNIGGKYNSTSWLSDATTFTYAVSVGDTIELSFEDTASSWTGNFEGIQLNDLMWNDGTQNQKINTSSLDVNKALKSVLAGDMQTLAMMLYPEDFEHTKK